MEFKNIFRLINKNARSCLQCGSVVSIDDSLFCPYCKAKLFSDFSCQGLRQVRGLGVLSLFTWKADENRGLSLLLENLKGEKMSESQRFYSQVLMEKYLRQTASLGPHLIIPAPARLPGQKDHAYAIAQFISDQSGWPMQTPLFRQAEQCQKTKSKQERQALQMGRDESFSISAYKNTQILFVDDIVTTGSTIYAAYQALQCPKAFKALTWADRRLAARP